MKPKFPLLFIALIAIALSAQAQSRKIMTFAGSGGAGGFSGDGFTSTAAVLNGPISVSADRLGNVYFVDYYNFRVRKVNKSGTIVTFAGTGIKDPRTDSTLASAANINPIGVAADRRGNVFISDAHYNVVYRVNKTGILTIYAGNKTAGWSGDGGRARFAKLNHPYGLAVDNKDNLYIADAGNHAIRKVDTFGIISTIGGTGTAGYTGDGGAATAATLDTPHAVAVDKHGAVYIADRHNNVVRKIDTLGNMSTFAGLGPIGYTGDGMFALSARFHYPAGVAVDTNGFVYISDSYNDAVRMVDTFGYIYTLAGNGTPGFGGDLGYPEGSNLFNPNGLAIDSSGTLFIADANNQRVRRIYHITVGVEEVSKNTNINIYPNPASQNITVTGALQGDKVAVMDVTGKIVTDTHNAENEQAISISLKHLPTGNYYIRVTNNKVVTAVKSFHKQ